MDCGILKKILTNNNRFKPDNPEYRRVILLNSILVGLAGVLLVYAVFQLFVFRRYVLALINTLSLAAAFSILIFFHKTDNIKVSTYGAIVIFFIVMAVLFALVGLKNYILYWIAVFPPVLYSLLGRKRARIPLILFCGYMLYFILSRRGEWQSFRFNWESLLNICGATFVLILLIINLENSRIEVNRELERANAALEDDKKELKLILDLTAKGIYVVDARNRCSFCNARCLELLGYTDEEELLGKNMHHIAHHSRRDGSKIPISQCPICNTVISGENLHSADGLFWRSDGTSFDVEYFSYPKYKDGLITGAVVTFNDITERKRNEQRIKYLSCHDALTGLLNRQSFEEKLRAYDREEFLPLSIIYTDLNVLKLTNDIFGHAAGDRLLKKTAQVLKRVFSKDDIIARAGGDEFILLLPGTQAGEAKKIVERLRNVLSKEKVDAISCSMSMGYDTKESMDQDIRQTLKNAENQMYREKTMLRKSIGMETIHEIMDALHKKSPREKIHSETIARLCCRMGAALGWSDAEIKQLHDAGYFHDIGKIILSEDLLGRIDELTLPEYSEKQQHAVVGYRILNLFDNTLDLADIVYYHHEQWDGSGYPKGLKGEEIPIQSRIIAVTEQFDYLTNPANKHPLSKEAALKRIRCWAGIKYDPKIVEFFIEMMSSQNINKIRRNSNNRAHK